MGPMSSPDAPALPERDRRTLLALARASIEKGLQGGFLNPDLDELSDPLREDRASFVTLKTDGRLRGCIGSLEAHQPLALDVIDNAYAAAFRDPRFQPLAPEELDGLHIHISVLGRPEPLEFDSEQDLIARLRPGIDGLILREGTRRGTFLPSVWESLPEPAEFLRQLKRKAGLPADYWSDRVQVWRYTTESFS